MAYPYKCNLLFRVIAFGFARLAAALADTFLAKEAASLHADLCRIHVLQRHLVISAHIADALVAGEDHRFFCHYGIDHVAFSRAVLGYFFGRNWGGGSTIEQQLVRTIRRDYSPSVARKFREMALASTVSRALSKIEVIRTYLSVAYFGAHMNGIVQAGKRMGVDIGVADPWEAAQLVARLKYPEPRRASPNLYARINARACYIFSIVRKSP